MEFIRFTIFTSMDRNAAIVIVREAISGSNGWIVDQSFFSNIAATIIFEIPLASLQEFQAKLFEKGLNASVEEELPKADRGEVRGTVSMTFSHDEPDLTREVPPFGCSLLLVEV